MSFADEFKDKEYGAFIKLSPFASKIAITLFYLQRAIHKTYYQQMLEHR